MGPYKGPSSSRLAQPGPSDRSLNGMLVPATAAESINGVNTKGLVNAPFRTPLLTGDVTRWPLKMNPGLAIPNKLRPAHVKGIVNQDGDITRFEQQGRTAPTSQTTIQPKIQIREKP